MQHIHGTCYASDPTTHSLVCCCVWCAHNVHNRNYRIMPSSCRSLSISCSGDLAAISHSIFGRQASCWSRLIVMIFSFCASAKSLSTPPERSFGDSGIGNQTIKNRSDQFQGVRAVKCHARMRHNRASKFFLLVDETLETNPASQHWHRPYGMAFGL